MGRAIRIRAAATAAVSCLAVAGWLPASQPAAASAALCGSMAGTAPHISKVLWVVMENESYGTGSKAIPGSPSAPYIKNSLASQCGSTTNYHAITHPSYPNYIAMTSGDTQGVTTDTLSYVNAPSIFSQVDPSWRGYEEFMPTNCDHVGQTGKAPPSQYYVGRHNPAASYSALPVGAPTAGDCKTNDVPMGSTTTGALHNDVTAGSLPRFSMITPGLCNDMHALPTGDNSCPDVIAGGDNWLSTWIPTLTSGPDYTSGNLLIDVVWDEGHGGTRGVSCINSSVADCIVPNIVISPYTPPVMSSANLSHYSLLKTTEELLNVPLLAGAADPSTSDLCGLGFGICPAPDTPPVAAFTYSCTGLACTFDGSGSTAPGSSITDYAWDFGDTGTASGVTTSHTFAAEGTYSVTLTVTAANGQTNVLTKQVQVSPQAAEPIGFIGSTGVTGTAATENVTVPAAVAAGDVMVLTATGVTTSPLTAPAGWALAGTQPNSVMTTSVWTKVASASDAGSSVTVGFPAAVKGAVQLLAYSGVDPTSPVAAFAAAGTHTTSTQATTPAVSVPTAGDWLVSTWAVKSSAVTNWTAPAGTVQRDSQIGTGGGRISAMLADGGGPAAAGPAGGLAATTDQSFSSSDTTSLVLAASCGSGGCPAPAPTAAFSSSCHDLTCTFDGSGSTAPGSSVTDYSWDFGDGGTDSGATPPDHTYVSGATYNVTLTVTNADGLTDSITHQVTVSSSPPPGIGFVAATGVTKNATSESVTVPSSVLPGNAMVLVATGVTTSALQAPAGWTLVTTQPNPVMTTSVWSRVATAADPGSTVQVTFPAQVKGSVQLAAYSGTSTTAPVAVVMGAATHVTASTATTPAITMPTAGDWLLSYWTVKSSAVTSLTGQAGTTARNLAVGIGGGQVTSLLADSGAGLPAGSAGGLNATADQPFSASTTFSLALAPGP